MQDAGKLLSAEWVAKTDQEAANEFSRWDKARQKKWQQDYLTLSLQAFNIVLINAKETLGKVNAIKDAMKTAIDGTEKVIAAKRKSNEPLSDGERAWVTKAKSTIAGSEAAVSALTKSFTDNSPFAGRIDYYRKAVEVGALTPDVPTKIKAARQAGIDVGNEFGKSGPVTNRMAEFRTRWEVLTKELEGLEKQRTGKAQEWAAQLNKQLKDFQAGTEKWVSDLDFTLNKVATNLKNALGTIDARSPKNFGESLTKAIKLKFSSKAQGKAGDEKKAIQLNLKMAQDRLKEAKGSLKTRLVEYQSLEAQLKNAGPYADPQRKVLSAIGGELTRHQEAVQKVATDVDAAVTVASR